MQNQPQEAQEKSWEAIRLPGSVLTFQVLAESLLKGLDKLQEAVEKKEEVSRESK